MNNVFTECRGCRRRQLQSVLSLGKTPLANRLLTADALHVPEPTYPLELVFCSHCSLVQITETVPPAELFREYFYFSSFSDTMVRHAETLVERVIREYGVQSQHFIVEIASNDGYLLQHYRKRGIPVLGIEPAQNVAEVARLERGVETISDFFSLDLAKQLVSAGRMANVVHSHNVLAHVADLPGFVAGVAELLQPNGIWINESPYLFDLLDNVEFDTIYHEHLCYFSLAALKRVLQTQGLYIQRVERLAIHGGTLRTWVTKQDVQPHDSVAELVEYEQARGVDDLQTYQSFADRVENLKAKLNGLLRDLKAQGKRLAAYGASAKGSTLLNYCGIGSDLLDFVADRSTAKRGRFTPGTHLPIISPDYLLLEQPDYVLLLTWNFAEEILKQQSEYRRLGGRFIFPIPEPQII